ncbi:hypothetical protein CYMTET_54973 [Cymbomonas tetramitiformis]|uniref:Uncharacterized protein n=1 Tax=Cymbomonas tetramitiformis TaxID=36881 RepID=A0AAE0BDV6_9CHLO|nr:hypothetical protein CYMTET_54973 [Cymbomonas tetramitiformis]
MEYWEDKLARYGTGLSGAVFGAGWWVWVDAIVTSNAKVPGSDWVPGIIATLAHFMMNCTRRDSLQEYDPFNDGADCRVRSWLFLSYVVSFSSLITAVWLLVDPPGHNKDDGSWTGVVPSIDREPLGGMPAGHFMGYWRIAVNGDGHWNDLDDGMWLSLWYPSGGYCLFERVGDSSAAGSIYVQCLGAFSPAGGLVIDTHFMGYWHLVVKGDGHWNDLDDGMWLSLWYPSDGYCLFECVGDSSTARFLGVSWIRLTLAPSPCTVLMVITHAGGLVFFDLDMKYWRIAVNGDGRRAEVGFGRRLSLWCHSGGHCLLESSVDLSVVLRGDAEVPWGFFTCRGLVVDSHFMGYWRIAVNGDGHWNDLDDGMWLSLWYPSGGYCLFEGVGDSSAAGSIYVQCLGAFSPAGGLVIDTHFMGYWHLVVNGDGHWNDLDDGMWLSLWYPSDGYCLFECVGDSSTARFLGVSWIRLTLAPSPCTVLMVITHAGGLVFFDLDMKYWRIAVNGDGRRVEVGFGRRLSLWCHSGGHCLLESSVDSSVVLRGEAEGGDVHLLCFPLNFVGST